MSTVIAEAAAPAVENVVIRRDWLVKLKDSTLKFVPSKPTMGASKFEVIEKVVPTTAPLELTIPAKPVSDAAHARQAVLPPMVTARGKASRVFMGA